MPILKNAKKTLRASKRKATFNNRVKSIAKTVVDKFTKEPSLINLCNAQSAIDKAVKKNIFAKNKASRMKAKISKLAKTAGVKLEKKVKTVKVKTTKTASKKATKK